MSAPRKLAVVATPDKGREMLDELAGLLCIGRIASITQRGRDPLSSPYTIHMDDERGTAVRVGTIKTLRSQPALGDVLAVTLGRLPPAIEPKLWHKTISGVVNHAVAVDEVEGESFTDLVREWLVRYSESATSDRNGAISNEQPFTQADAQGLADIYIHIGHFIADLDRRYSIKVKPSELHIPLADIGLIRRTLNYTKNGKPSTRSYWTAPMDVLSPADGLIG